MKKKIVMLVVSMMICASLAACGNTDAVGNKNDKVDVAIETVSEDVTETSEIEEEPTEVDVVEEEPTKVEETQVKEPQDVFIVNENIKAGLEDLVHHYTEKVRETDKDAEEIEVPDEFVIESCEDLGLSDDATFRDFFEAVRTTMVDEADAESFTDEEVEEYIYVAIALYNMPEVTVEGDDIEIESSFNTDTTSEDTTNKINESTSND